MTNAQLKAFHAVARFGSFTIAAERLGLSQPAVSDHIKKLEMLYGTTLFLRHAKGAALTEIGKKLFAIAERNAETEQEALLLLSRAQKLEEGDLVIGADAAVHVLPLLKRFKILYPGIRLRLESGNSTELIAKLKAFTIDFAVAAVIPEDPGIAATRISQSPLVMIVGAASPQARLKSVKFAAVAAIPLIMREQGSATRQLVQQKFAKNGLRYRLAMEVEGRETVQEAVSQGLGAAIVSAAEVTPDRRIKAVPLSDGTEKMEEWLLHLKSRASLRLIEAFLQLLNR